MLNCPFCSFENPDNHPVCDQCGQPLQRWYSISWPDTDNVTLPENYLEAAQRYQPIGAPIYSSTVAGLTVVGQIVLDCQPTTDSPLKELQSLWLDQPSLNPSTLPETATVPPAAFPYLALQADYFPAVPELHDALHIHQHTLLILEDRSLWPTLAAVWPHSALDPLQQTQWLFEITLLWQALAVWQGQATLLNPNRLVLSPNSLLCLTHLDIVPGPPPTLQDLGLCWQRHLLHEPSPAEALRTLIKNLAEGTLTDIESLQEALAELAGQYRSTSPLAFTTPVTPPADAITNDSDDLLLTEDWGPMGRSLSDEELIQLAESQGALAEAEDGSSSLELPTMVLPMKLFALDDAGQSHVGQQRNHNEDWFFTETHVLKANDPYGPNLQAQGLYILCDGMGGHASGEVASQLAVQTLREYFAQAWSGDLPDEDSLIQGVIKANQVIFNTNQEQATSGIGRMGTTLVMLLVKDLQAAVVHVGDSRLYSYCKRLGLRQLTVDHEVGQREINRGVEPAIAYARPDAYQLTQALGPRSQNNLKPGVTYHDIVEDTLFILCSDGLSDNDLLERYEASHIAPLLSTKVNLEHGVADLIQLANEKNGHDNITAIVVRLKLRPDIEQLSGQSFTD